MLYFSDNLKHLRKKRGLTQEDFAAEIGVKRTTIANYETGVSEPGAETLLSIAAFLGVNLQDLLTVDFRSGQLPLQAEETTSPEPLQYWSVMQHLKHLSGTVAAMRKELDELRKVQ